MLIALRKVPGFNSCTGVWLFLCIRDSLLLTIGFNRYHMDIEVSMGGKQLIIGPSIQYKYEHVLTGWKFDV